MARSPKRPGISPERLRDGLGDDTEGMLTLTARADPVLAELWGNRRDAAYDRLPPGRRTIGSFDL